MNANLIKAKMKEKGVTQAEVAKMIGISTNSLSRKMLGKRDFKLSEVRMLCDALSIENRAEIFLD